MRVTLGNLICASILLLNISCESKSYEEIAEKDSQIFFSNLDDSEKLLNHPMTASTELPAEFLKQNKAKFIKELQQYFGENCEGSKDFKLLDSYRKIGDDSKRNLFLEFEFCTSGIVIMSYEVVDNDVTLFGVWPMKKDEKPEALFTDEQSW